MLSTLLLLAAAPCAFTATVYNPPAALLAKSQVADDCILPKDFHVKDFVARSNGSASALECYSFTFTDPDTSVSTACHYNSTSKSPSDSSASHPRYPCDNEAVTFIWEDDSRRLSMIENICPGTDGLPEYEVSGSAILKLSCASGTNNCAANMTDYHALFVSLQPASDPAQ